MNRFPLLAALAATLILLASGVADATKKAPKKNAEAAEPLVIGHRGASGYRPEHTLAAYELAARMGADYIEPDLVITKDGVLVARHENEISQTTDVSERAEFASRKTSKTIDGAELEGWFTEDFTLAELKTLRAKERIPQTRQENTIYDGRYEVPTLQEVIDLAQRFGVGIYPETKHPTYFRSIGKPLEEPLVETLRANKLDDAKDPVFVQSFETGNLKALDKQIDVPLVQLFGGRTHKPFGDTRTYGELATAAGLREVAEYADGAGPPKDYVLAQGSSFVADAHGAGLLVHPYTFRNENQFLPADLRSSSDLTAYGNAFEEYRRAFAAGVDGVFSDNPDTAVAARDAQNSAG